MRIRVPHLIRYADNVLWYLVFSVSVTYVRNLFDDSVNTKSDLWSLFKVTQKISLTDQHVLDLSRWLSEDYDIRKLSTRLGVREHDIDAELEKKNDKRDAAHAILKLWRRSQECQVQAYVKLGEALVKVGFQRYAAEALKYRPPGSM